MTTAEVRSLFDYLKEHQAPLVKLVAGVEPPVGDRGPLPARAAEAVRARGREAFRVRRAPPGGSTRPCIRSRAGPATTTSGSRPATSRTRSRASSPRCTRSGTASTSTRSPTSSSGRRSAGGTRSGCTSRRAGCGRTSSAARCRSGGTSSRALVETFPERVRRLRRRALVPRDQRRPAVADPSRGGRGDLQPPHHPALRARAGDARRVVPAREPARGVEPAHVGAARRRGAGRHGAACSRTPTGRSARSATSRPTRSGT